MSGELTRMAFCMATLAAAVSCAAASEISLRITSSPVRRGALDETKPPRGDRLCYGVSSFMQIDSETALGFLDRNVYTEDGAVDFEDGFDVVTIASLDELATARPLSCGRSGIVEDSDFAGTNRYHVNYGCLGGFVPRGASMNGAPHPHAGTGFGISQITSHPVAPDGTFSWQSEGRVGRRFEFYDLRFDGNQLVMRKVRDYTEREPLRIPGTDWTFKYAGLGSAIPDGADLLLPSIAQRNGDATVSSGVSRWRMTGEGWRPVDFVSVGGQGRGEPSLVRTRNGRLLFAARDDHREGQDQSARVTPQDLLAWVSDDNGVSWRLCVDIPEVRCDSPVSIGRAADGTPYLAGNPSAGVTMRWDRRNRLVLWPLDIREMTDTGSPILARDAQREFADGTKCWNVDHPICSVIRFADGKLHGLLSYRVRDWWTDLKTGKGIAVPSVEAGAYVEEVEGTGAPLPVWKFNRLMTIDLRPKRVIKNKQNKGEP